MKIPKPLAFIVLVLFLTAISAHSQMKYGGRVVEVVDGKTCVIEMPNGKLTAVLQYIEVPDPEQPLHQTVKDHLQNLILDKTVEFMPRNVLKTKTVGRLSIKGVDISQQMLRDGAAWYSLDEQENHSESERLLYQNNETQARNEKRGVWGVPDLKPVWEYRAEKEAIQRKLEKDEWMRMVEKARRVSGTQSSRAAPEVEMWANIEGASQYNQPFGVGGLRQGYEASKRIGVIFTPSVFVDFPQSDFLKKVESRIYYGYRGDKKNIEWDFYFIGFLMTSKNYKFLKPVGITIIADGQKIVLTRVRRYYGENLSSVNELMFGMIRRADLIKIAKAEKISVQIGKHRGVLSNDSLMYITNLINVT